MAFPTQGLVIGVPVTLVSRVEETHGCGPGQTGFDPLVSRQGRNLNRHAWMALVAFVVAARRHRTEPAFLFKKKILHTHIYTYPFQF